MTLHFLCLNKQWQIKMSIPERGMFTFPSKENAKQGRRQQDSNKNTKNTHTSHNTQFNAANSSCSVTRRSAELQRAQPGNKDQMHNCINTLHGLFWPLYALHTESRESVHIYHIKLSNKRSECWPMCNSIFSLLLQITCSRLKLQF